MTCQADLFAEQRSWGVHMRGGKDLPHEYTQEGQIVRYMMYHGSITPRDAMVELGVYRLAARIHDLRAKGWKIETTDENGHARYTLK